jgi:hypothetical protein
MDEIRLTLPDEPRFYPVAHLVLGGLGSRLQLTVDGLDDLRLAVDSLLERARRGSEVTIAIRIENETLFTDVGPFEPLTLERELAAAERSGVIGLRRILDTVVDDVVVRVADGGAWVTLEKRLAG